MSRKLKKLSKFLSYVLRHAPEKIGLSLDGYGWAEIDQLLEHAARNGMQMDLKTLRWVVEHNDKKRFSISTDGTKIRANQGHSIPVNLNLVALAPPDTLLHGTAKRFLPNIWRDGLKKMTRHHVHLTEKMTIAYQVGSRYGSAAILQIDSFAMHRDGIPFYRSENEVWLVDTVSPQYLSLIKYNLFEKSDP